MNNTNPETGMIPPAERNNWEEAIEELEGGYDWRINIITDPEDPDFVKGLDIVSELRSQYGEENVLVNLVARDPDTEKLARIRGKIGVHVRKGVERKPD